MFCNVLFDRISLGSYSLIMFHVLRLMQRFHDVAIIDWNSGHVMLSPVLLCCNDLVVLFPLMLMRCVDF